jgi:hypothetical protein
MSQFPSELAAVLHIFSHDNELRTRALPHVDIENRSIDWEQIFDQYYGAGHHAALLWALSLWRDTTPEELLSESFFMDAGLRRTVLRAIAIRWCIPMDGVTALQVA